MKIKKNLPLILPVFFAVALIISTFTISANSSESKTVLHNNQEALIEDVIKEETVLEEWYLIREYEGIIGVFDYEGNLIQTIPVYIITLPKRDRDLLHKGIEVKSKGDLLGLIQDYTS